MVLDFRLANLDDLPVWIKLREELYGDLEPDYNEREIRRTVADPALTSFIVHIDTAQEPVGMLELSLRNIVDGCVSSPVAYIEGLYVKEPWQNKGFGKQMIAYAKRWGLEQGCRELAVDTELDNEKPQVYYARLGFEETYRVVQFRM